jgi:hypothetical protein
VRWQSNSAAIAGRGARRRAGVLACVDGGQDEDEDFVFGIIHRRGIVAVLGCEVALGRGLLVGWLLGLPLGCHGQVSPGDFSLFFFCFYFLFSNFYFEFRFEFNFSILQVLQI